ncbi:FecCD family ABC transporter permease [Gallibacterium salpingitidis]|uniref:FecCD family ABC transporter permease n=1 Tax=Gallibacterium salpingitidis TaxID=505341 RepID=UPI0008259814|nr:iron ABC transporter permease [Gallibacterium salpingitidis]
MQIIKFNNKIFLAVSFVILITLTLLSLNLGAIHFDISTTLFALIGKGDANTVFILQQLRLPRTLLAIIVGGILGVSGTILQGLFRNPLADSGVIGISAGAALGAAIAIVLLPASLLFWQRDQLIALFAFVGGLITTLLVYRIGRTTFGTNMLLILLGGIAIGSLAFAFLGLLQFLADDQALRELTIWQLGSLAQGNFFNILLCLLAFILLFWQATTMSQALNAMLLGDLEAKHLGINIEKIKKRCIYLIAFAIGIAVSVTGMIGFIGLVVPHIARTLLGADHKKLIPITAVLGAILLLLADIVARSIAPPAEIPIGILTALLGAPFFIGLLIKHKKEL